MTRRRGGPGWPRKVGNLLALSLLNMLTATADVPLRDGPSVLRERGKDNAIKINWGSFYTVVQNLEKHGFIEAIEVAREGRQPERTTYQITDAGRAEGQLTPGCASWSACQSGSTPVLRRPSGEAAVLPPDELIGLLRQRLAALEEANNRMAAELATLVVQPPAPAVRHRVGVLPVAAPGRRGVGARAAEGVH